MPHFERRRETKAKPDSFEIEETSAVDDIQANSLQAHTLVSPRSITVLILRIRALVTEWIKIEIDEDTITSAEGIINENVVRTFMQAGGDLCDAIPFALLEARKGFVMDARSKDCTLNEQRALACEILARRAVALAESSSMQGREECLTKQSTHISLSKRFVQLEEDGDRSMPTSAMESAVDQNCVIFLSGPEAQRCAEDIWKGRLTQTFHPSGLVFFEPHQPSKPSFLGCLDPNRLSVPQYSYYSGLIIHIALIVIYTFSTLEYTGLDYWEIALWITAAGYLLDDLTRWFKMRSLDKINSFWVLIDLSTDALFVTSFVIRVIGWLERDDDKASGHRLLAFQFLACIAPFLWMQLLKLADGFQYFGVIQIVLLRMLQETAAFFLLLLLTAVGFAQCFFALDAADSHRVENSVSVVINMLMAAILGNPDFDAPAGNFGQPFGLIMFYLYSFITVMLLANILVAFFSSAYDKTVDNATDVFRAYFCSKVVSAIRAPDEYVYLPPFNLIEAFLIAPFEPVLPTKVYAQINNLVQGFLFIVPLSFIALYESQVQGKVGQRIRMEMLDDLPEERTRRLREASGLKSSIEDPTFDDDEIPESASKLSVKVTLSREEFAAAAKEYVQSLTEPTASGSHVYARGWKWVEGGNPPFTTHLSRTFTLPSVKANKKDDQDAALLDSMAVAEDDNDEATTSTSAGMTISVTQTVCYSATWKVPVLYLEATDSSGSPLSVEDLCASPLFLSKESSIHASSQVADGLAIFPTISMGENPANGHDSAYLHPCETAKWIATLLESESKSDSSVSFLESFMMLCGTVVEMRPGNKGGLDHGDKILTFKVGKEGKDMVISKVKFTELLGKLPKVKSEEEEEKDNRAVTTKDLQLVLDELKALREELANVKSAAKA
ncbi:hypothetical protein CBS101457_006489 [Exobasidium rhododendri]|nr:hypothetical protein CBS101457_006489 [Exobasidium rhododendri]